MTPRIALNWRQVDVRDRADAGMRHVELAGVCLHVGHELLEVLRRKILPGEDQDRGAGNHSDRLEIYRRVVSEVRVECDRSRVGAHVTRYESVAVRRRAHGAGRFGCSGGADNKIDDDLMPKRARHGLGDNPRNDVGRAPGGERYYQRDIFIRKISLRGGETCRCKREHTCEPYGF